MDIIVAVEKVCLDLERNNESAKAAELHHKTVNILHKAKPPPPNLNHLQRKGLSFFKRKNELAVAPFDKGKGFVTLERN